MGTGILATLLQTYAATDPLRPAMGLHEAAIVLLVLAWVLLIGLSTGFVRHVRGDTGRGRAMVTDPATQPLWGTVAMGVLAVGAATVAVVPAVAPGATALAVDVSLWLWVMGTVLGTVTAVGFAVVIARGDAGEPSLVWGLPVVPPMVSATVGAGLVTMLPRGSVTAFALLVVSAASFVMALTLGLVVFSLGYHHHWRVAPVALAASASTWIPLGIVGQSTAGAQALAAAAATHLDAATSAQLHGLGVAYGVVALAVGVPLAGWAAVVTVRGFAGRMPFTTGWWALTFPVGTLALGLHHLGRAMRSGSVTDLGAGALVVLCGTWTLCAVASARAVLTQWRGARPLSAGR
ncbi:MAG: C4-dicarboxylate transporter/malic acid transport protein [Humibacillus sp.]|nr:C4-dicarboxylate transporter/malic acid transport protein [Humibacillus sp.]